MSETSVPTVPATPKGSETSSEADEDWTEVDAWGKCLKLLRFRDDDPEYNAFENTGTTDLFRFLVLTPKDISSLVSVKGTTHSLNESRLRVSARNIFRNF